LLYLVKHLLFEFILNQSFEVTFGKAAVVLIDVAYEISLEVVKN